MKISSYSGLITHAHISNRMLTDEEVKFIYDHQFCKFCKPIKTSTWLRRLWYWFFKEAK